MSEREHLQNGRLERLRARARVLRAIREYFEREGFLEVETPSRVPSPGMDLHLDAFPAGEDRWLITSPEYQMKRLVVGGAGDIYQIDHPYLDTESNGLSYLIEKMQGQHLYAHVNLEKGERSQLAEMASNVL